MLSRTSQFPIDFKLRLLNSISSVLFISQSTLNITFFFSEQYVQSKRKEKLQMKSQQKSKRKENKAVRVVVFWKPEYQELLNSQICRSDIRQEMKHENCEIKYSLTKSYKLSLFDTFDILLHLLCNKNLRNILSQFLLSSVSVNTIIFFLRCAHS